MVASEHLSLPPQLRDKRMFDTWFPVQGQFAFPDPAEVLESLSNKEAERMPCDMERGGMNDNRILDLSAGGYLECYKSRLTVYRFQTQRWP